MISNNNALNTCALADNTNDSRQ